MKPYFILTIFLIFKTAYGDIGNLDSRQGNIYPTKNTNISMSREYVYITLKENEIDVYAKFWMYNNDKKSREKVGFPADSSCGLNSSLEISNFWCKFNSQKIKVKTKTIKKKIVSRTFKRPWYYWEMDFAANDTTIVEVGYTGHWGEDGFSPTLYFTYLIGTGNTWADSIGYGKIIFDHTNYLSTNFVTKCYYELSPDWDSRRFFQKISRPGINVQYNENTTIYTFQNYLPKKDEMLSISFIDYNSAYIDKSKEYITSLLKCQKQTNKQLYDMKNEILARKGYIFQNEELLNEYLNKSWYKPQKNICIEDLSLGEFKFYCMLAELEKLSK